MSDPKQIFKDYYSELLDSSRNPNIALGLSRSISANQERKKQVMKNLSQVRKNKKKIIKNLKSYLKNLRR